MKYNFIVREVGKSSALQMVRKYHYSDTLPRINRHFLGCFLEGKMVGLVTLGFGTRPRHTIQCLWPQLDTKDYLEIGRMCMTEDMPRNSESQMLSAVASWIKQNVTTCKVLFTWADGIMGKPGYVYQACSYWYAGFIESEIYERDGIKLHVRGMKPLLVADPKADKRKTVRPTIEQMRKLGINHYRGRQFRYLKFLCGRKEQKRLMGNCAVPLTRAYPKTNDLKWRKRDTASGKWIECQMPRISTDEKNAERQSLQMSLFDIEEGAAE